MELKRCCACKLDKGVEDYHADRTQKDGRTRRCKQCTKESHKRWQAADPERARAIWRKATAKNVHKVRLRKYGLTTESYVALLDAQGGRCAICRTPAAETKGRVPGVLVVDHCHDSKEIRGLLCSGCNLILGMADDNIERLAAAVKYLQSRGA